MKGHKYDKGFYVPKGSSARAASSLFFEVGVSDLRRQKLNLEKDDRVKSDK